VKEGESLRDEISAKAPKQAQVLCFLIGKKKKKETQRM